MATLSRRRNLAAALRLIWGWAGLSSAAMAGDLPQGLNFFRQAEIRVPFSALEFAADGHVSELERGACAVARQFVTYEPNARGDDRTAVYLAHTGNHFYVGFSVKLPEGKTPSAKATKRDDSLLWKKDDAIEVMVAVNGKTFDFIGNAAGVCGDYLHQPNDGAWSHEAWTYAARKTEGGWEGEFLFGADVFGLPTFTPEIDCQLDVVNNAKTLYLAGLAYRGGAWQANSKFYPRIRFGAPGQAYRSAQEIGTLENRRLGLESTLANPGQQTARVEAWAALYRAKEGKDVSYFQEISGLYDTSGIAVLPGATDEELIRHVMGQALEDYVEAGALKKTLEIAAGGTETVDLWKPSSPGTYLVAELFRDADGGQVIAGDIFPFSLGAALKTSVDYYYLTARKIEAFTLAPSDPSITKLRYIITNLRSGRQVAERTVDSVASGRQVRTSFSTADWPAGQYRLDVESAGAGEQAADRYSVPFEKPETPEWFQSNAGKLIQLPPPWPPVKASEDAVEVYGRRYQWANGPFMERIVSQGRDLLASPIRLPVMVDGKDCQWSESRPALKERDEAKAVYQTETSAGPVDLRATATVEFDGMCRFDLTLSAQSPATVDQLFLEIPLRRETATLFSRAQLGLMPATEVPKEWDERYAEGGKTPEKGLTFPFTPSVALRNDRVGLEWFAEWDWGWSNNSQTDLLEIAPQGETTLLRARFIDRPVRLDKPRTLTFGLQAWPVKPWPDKERNVSNYLTTVKMENDAPPPFHVSLGETKEAFAQNLTKAKNLGMDVLLFFHWNSYRSADGSIVHPPEYPALLAPEVEERVRIAGEVTQEAGVPVTGHCGFGLPPTAPVFEHYGKEMAVHPIINKGIWGYKFTAYSPLPDAWVYGFKKLGEECHWSGVQLDGAYAVHYNEAEETGCAVRDENGKLRGRYPLFAYRDFARRLYNVYHGEVQFPGTGQGFVYCHAGGHLMGPIHGFCDAIHSGEDTTTMLAKHLQEIDLGRERALYASGAFGVPRDLLSKTPKAPVGPQGRIAFAIQLGMNMMHERILNWVGKESYRRNSYPVHRLWAARQWVGARPDNYVWHDESRQYLTMDLENMCASFHLQPGKRMLLGISNWEEGDRTVEIRLNAGALGFEGKPLAAEDAITDRPVAVQAGELSLLVNGDGYRLIKIHVDEKQ